MGTVATKMSNIVPVFKDLRGDGLINRIYKSIQDGKILSRRVLRAV